MNLNATVNKLVNDFSSFKESKKSEIDPPKNEKSYSIWHDKERLEKTKVPPVKPMLVLDKNTVRKMSRLKKLLLLTKFL